MRNATVPTFRSRRFLLLPACIASVIALVAPAAQADDPARAQVPPPAPTQDASASAPTPPASAGGNESAPGSAATPATGASAPPPPPPAAPVTVSLLGRDPVAPDAVPARKSSAESGMIGSLLFAGSLQNGSWGSDSERSCTSVGSSCSASGASGGGLLFSLGYMWQPLEAQPVLHVGFDLLFGATVDAGSRSYVDTSGASRTYAVERVGGLTAVRLRAAVQSSAFRLALAAGPGFAFRAVGISDSAPGIPSDGGTYRALALTADGSLQVRLGTSTALAVGVMAWSENTGSGLQSSHGPSGAPLTFLSGWNGTLLPYAGFQFGS